jgi:DNA-binding MarR family transcriptional regulator
MAKNDVDMNETDGAMIAVPLERLARLMRAGEYENGLNPAQWEALRYLSRANRFSNSPGALTRYLGATKGTISQTVKALERKGYVTKASRPGEKRSITLVLTPKGEEALSRDPWSRLSRAADNLGGKTRRRMLKGLRELLAAELQRGNHQSFGLCSTCRHFGDSGRKGDALGPHLCKLLSEPLSAPDATRICAEHEDRAA